jgi:hypothetical protein
MCHVKEGLPQRSNQNYLFVGSLVLSDPLLSSLLGRAPTLMSEIKLSDDLIPLTSQRPTSSVPPTGGYPYFAMVRLHSDPDLGHPKIGAIVHCTRRQQPATILPESHAYHVRGETI